MTTRTEQKVGPTPGPRSMQHRGDLAEYHSLAEGGEVVGVFAGQNARADALLDAAAPDLVAVCKEILAGLGESDWSERMKIKLRAALAKASA